MAYEYESRISNSIDRDKNYFFTTTSKDMKDELQEVYRKAKAMDEIEQSYWKSNTPENFAYEFVRIFENRFSSDKERADDEVNGNTKPKNDSVRKYIDRLDDDNIMG